MNDLIEGLLYEEESATLDFKRDQYPLQGASDEQKSEVVKDILAFANAWRRTTAYILIGVEEVKGGRSRVVGIKSHFDEASLQQLVNSKTNRPIEFAYKALSFEGASLGLIVVPLQQRPIFLKKDFGKLKANWVYVRRGSSTAVADPDEISQMGAATALDAVVPVIDLQFADPEKRVALGPSLKVESLLVKVPERSSIPSLTGGFGLLNADYYREYAEYLEQIGLLQPFGFMLYNSGSTLAINARLEIECAKNDGLVFSTFRKRPPAYQSVGIITNFDFALRDQLYVKDFGDRWVITSGFGSVQAKAKSWTTEIFVGGQESGRFEFSARLFADNLPSPAEVSLTINVKASETRRLSVEDLIRYVEQQDRH